MWWCMFEMRTLEAEELPIPHQPLTITHLRRSTVREHGDQRGAVSPLKGGQEPEK